MPATRPRSAFPAPHPTSAPPPRRSGRVAALSARGRETAEHVAAGRTNRAIGGILFLSEKTVETHLSRVFRKLGVRSRSQVAARTAARRDEPPG